MDFKWFQKLWTSEKSTISRSRILLAEIITQSHQLSLFVISINQWTPTHRKDKWRSWLTGLRVLLLVWDQERTSRSCISVDTGNPTSRSHQVMAWTTVTITEEVCKLKKHTTCKLVQLVNLNSVWCKNRLTSHCSFSTRKVTILQERMDLIHPKQQALPWALVFWRKSVNKLKIALRTLKKKIKRKMQKMLRSLSLDVMAQLAQMLQHRLLILVQVLEKLK